MSRSSTIFVFADWKGLGGPALMGQLHRSSVRGEEVLSFEYDKDWLRQSQPFLLDPRLQFVEGRQYADGTNPFGLSPVGPINMTWAPGRVCPGGFN